ncbi:glycosyltransferase family 9 protein [Candidatus Chrysopegis kryptomonas]|uniref:ADP-heptose:LPS heptosyltransferase n=1 Tax=Candidatus Chryseopegocella kryptomonas TaxID=1633643 RepID=A0A0P1P092_9BACT|nr:glycosyltransferase family 9 protein [Candidatus Chrysopegis kryptomonas]CUT04981.1 ADP-heptose:LPS heptosyltransferase [Candidatus Chrysopegis kryptomonas]
MKKFSNILVCRTDKIGDVILTLPVVNALKDFYPDARITFLVSEYASEILYGHKAIDEILIYNPSESVFELFKKIKEKNFDLAIVVFPVFKIALALWLARIPIRVGTGYRFYSFLFNKKIFEHRKYAQKHEVEYNLNLIREIGVEVNEVKFDIFIPQSAFERINQILEINEITPGNYIIVHPGSKGSARDLKPERFKELVKKLSEEGFKVILTGSESEKELVRYVAGNEKNVYDFSGLLNLKELSALIKLASVFVSNSTGPIHIASAVGTPVVGFYPPIKVMSPRRWGPYTENKTIFVPNVPFECKKCVGEKCKFFDCMDRINIDDVLRAIKEKVGVNV